MQSAQDIKNPNNFIKLCNEELTNEVINNRMHQLKDVFGTTNNSDMGENIGMKPSSVSQLKNKKVGANHHNRMVNNDKLKPKNTPIFLEKKERFEKKEGPRLKDMQGAIFKREIMKKLIYYLDLTIVGQFSQWTKENKIERSYLINHLRKELPSIESDNHALELFTAYLGLQMHVTWRYDFDLAISSIQGEKNTFGQYLRVVSFFENKTKSHRMHRNDNSYLILNLTDVTEDFPKQNRKDLWSTEQWKKFWNDRHKLFMGCQFTDYEEEKDYNLKLLNNLPVMKYTPKIYDFKLINGKRKYSDFQPSIKRQKRIKNDEMEVENEVAEEQEQHEDEESSESEPELVRMEEVQSSSPSIHNNNINHHQNIINEVICHDSTMDANFLNSYNPNNLPHPLSSNNNDHDMGVSNPNYVQFLNLASFNPNQMPSLPNINSNGDLSIVHFPTNNNNTSIF